MLDERIIFKKMLTFRSDFVKVGLEILNLFLAKDGRLLFCFVANLSDFGLLFQKLKLSSIYKDAIDLTSRRKVHFRQTSFLKMKYEKCSISFNASMMLKKYNFFLVREDQICSSRGSF